jgi:CRISPR-associated protein Csd2
MATLSKKIDFAVIVTVNHANPNGDPLNGNRPRVTYEGFGEMSDVSIKRKIRNRLMDMGKPIFVQSDDNRVDDYGSLRERADAVLKGIDIKDKKKYQEAACNTWLDVRAFGQVFAFKGKKSQEG